MAGERKCRALEGCDLILVSEAPWRATPVADRVVLRAAGYARHSGRGLCTNHYWQAARAGTLDQYPGKIRPSTNVAEDWATISLSQNKLESRAYRIREAAPRMGMTEHALEKALDRLGIAS